MNDPQKSEITQYLLAKKLPIDILIEVQDHFISQILDLQKEQSYSFEKSFESVKESWRKELTLSWKGETSLMDSTDFMRKMSKQIVRSNILESMKILVPYVLVIIFLANFANKTIFQIVFIVLISLPILYCIINYIKNYQDFRLPKNNPAHILTLHQDGIMWFVITLSPFINIFRYIFDDSVSLQNMLVYNFNGMETLNIVLGFLFLVFLFSGLAYSVICQKNYLKQVGKVKIFLEDHKFVK
ncbi:hypothetical protein [Frigoriflavimonas asaccharolytica]|uniref:Uncharacterized protein n=1 Tax=Frigoriflavimonas asaccharolytica TaxID=2735899 RepID=A0A8J8GBQ6_9FLAO|nr:hypothetical protein [Frigoriflavimonas asaccharolytica]NRS93612.1 hypothetical protein [Frigoriflavimonas asaccharolytica]